MKKYLTVCCLTAIALCTGCGHANESASQAVPSETEAIIAEEASATAETASETASETAESLPAEETQTLETTEPESIPTTPSITAEEAQAIADAGMQAVHENDAMYIIQHTTYGAVTRSIPDDSVPDRSDEGLASWLTSSWKEGQHHNMNDCHPFFLFTTSQEDSDFFNFTCQNPVPMTNIEVENFNAILQYAAEYFSKEDETKKIMFPEIIDGYSFDMVYEDGTTKENMKMYVLKTTDSEEYQFDLYYTPYAHSAVGFLALTQMASEQETLQETTK